MPKTNPETIVLKGNVIFKEEEAAATITPGMLLRRSGTNLVTAHNVAGGVAARLFARENDIAGDGIADAYASGEKVLIAAAFQGCEIYAILADGEDASIGDFLESDGAGALRVVTDDSSLALVGVGSIIGQCLTAVDAADSIVVPLADRRIKIEIV